MTCRTSRLRRTAVMAALAVAACRSPRERTVEASSRECEGLPPLAQKDVYSVGFVPIYETTNPWGPTNINDMIVETRRRGYKLVYKPPVTGTAAEQVARMQELTEAKVDLIVLRPIDATTLVPPVIAARKACIPVFTESRFLDATRAAVGTDYVTAIGADPAVQGQMVADWLIHATGGKATIIEIEGTPGSSSAIGRKKGFDGEIASHPAMKIVASQGGNFLREAGRAVARDLMIQFPAANVIYAHGDTMALGALSAAIELGRAPGKDLLIVSIDGLKEAVQHVIDGSIAAIAFNDPRFGAIVYDAVEKYASGHVVPAKIVLTGPIVDRTNAETMLGEAF